MLDRQPDATVQNGAPHSRRSDTPSLAFGLIPAAAVACGVLLIGIVNLPPRYIAHASFAVDWDSLRSNSTGVMTETMRRDRRTTFIAEMTSLPDSGPELSEVLDRAGDFSGSQIDKAAVTAKLQKRLRVILTGQTDTGDLFTIETRDDDPGVARMEADWVLQGTMSQLKAEAKAGGTPAVWRSLAEAGSGSRANLEGVLIANPIKAIQQAQAEARGAGYGLTVVLAAAVLGVMAGGLGLLWRQLILAMTALKSVAESAARRTGSPSSAKARSRRRRQIQAPQRPILLRPLPQYCAAGDLRRADGLSGLRE